MRRAAIAVVILYVFAAIGTRVAEMAGMQRCECSSSCWCRGPVLSAFRWVMPVGHRQRIAERVVQPGARLRSTSPVQGQLGMSFTGDCWTRGIMAAPRPAG
jgi:hypothetical protein